MAMAAWIPVSEYLRTSYEPDAEYVDGRMEERVVGERDHCDLQKKLLFMLNEARCLPWFDCIQELRVQVTENRFRVPDFSLLRADAPRERVVTTAPLLCIEVLSPEDTMSRTMVKVRDYLAMGVPAVWIVDPETRSIQVCEGSLRREILEGEVRVPETEIGVSLAEVFSVLPEENVLG